MKQKIQLQIPGPCQENWENMTATQQGRFCGSCRKEVIDFSVMTDKEILAYISTASSNMCGRIGEHQLNRDLITPPESRKIWWKYWMGVAASFVLLTAKSNAQVKTPKEPIVCGPSELTKGKPVMIRLGGMTTVKKNDPVNVQIHGRVVDDKNNPIPYASVRLMNAGAGVAADAAGNFTLNAAVSLSYLELSVSSVGYELKTISVNSPGEIKTISTGNGIVALETGNIILKPATMAEVIVAGNVVKKLSGIAGGISVGIRYSQYEKTKNKLKEVCGINEIKVYPNPISKNEVFNLRFNLKDKGNYAIQFTDASGKMISASQLIISSKNQLESFNSNMFPASGIYFVNLASKQSLKNYTTRLVVQ